MTTLGFNTLAGNTRVRTPTGLVRLDQISSGSQGPAGPAGPTGPQGPPGTVDTSQYYNKTQTDFFLALKQNTLDSNVGSGSTLISGSTLRRLIGGSNITVTEDADGNIVLTAAGGGSSGIPATIATFEANLIELKVATSCHSGLDVTGGIAADIVQSTEVKANSFSTLSASTVSLNGTQISQLYASSGSLGSS